VNDDPAGRAPTAARTPAGEPKIVVRPDAATATEAAATRIAAAIRASVAARGAAHWATTGGSTPGAIYRHLAAAPLRDTVPWEQVHLWWGDDRWVPPTDPLSNALACWDLLLRGVPVPAGQVHAIPIGAAMAAGESPAWAAVRYSDELHAAGLPRNDQGFPVLDIVFVGIGPDGHVFSVFPGSSTWGDPAWAQAVEAPTHVAPHVARVTLHPRILEAARLPLAVVIGLRKAEIVGPPADPRELPAVLARRRDAVWFLDEAAASLIPVDVRETVTG